MKQNNTNKAQIVDIAKPQRGQGKKSTRVQPEQTKAEVIKVGADVGLNKYAICRQVDGSLAEPPQMKTPDQFKVWIEAQKLRAQRVVVCYEAGFLGFELGRWLESQGIECVVMAPMKLDEANKRVETDKLNARDICSRLDRYLAGNMRALTRCRIPTREEELARHQTRLRQQLLDQRKALQAQGRSVLWQFGYVEKIFYHHWEQPNVWEFLLREIPEPQLLTDLGRLRAVLEEIGKQLEELNNCLAEQAAKALPEGLKTVPLGLGWLSMLILTREIMNWNRFKNRRQISCFSGLVPSEASTGESFRQGPVTKVGNPIVRAILVEMAWRLVRYQPQCRAVKKWLPLLQNKKAGARARKRAIVAVARVLIVDVWRLATGQTTAEKLGFK